jgi:hypothetical protein
MHRSDAISRQIAAANLICRPGSLLSATANSKCETLPEDRFGVNRQLWQNHSSCRCVQHFQRLLAESAHLPHTAGSIKSNVIRQKFLNTLVICRHRQNTKITRWSAPTAGSQGNADNTP